MDLKQITTTIMEAEIFLTLAFLEAVSVLLKLRSHFGKGKDFTRTTIDATEKFSICVVLWETIQFFLLLFLHLLILSFFKLT